MVDGTNGFQRALGLVLLPTYPRESEMKTKVRNLGDLPKNTWRTQPQLIISNDLFGDLWLYIYIHVAGARCPNKQTCTNYNSSTTEGTCTTSIAKQQLFGYLAAKKTHQRISGVWCQNIPKQHHGTVDSIWFYYSTGYVWSHTKTQTQKNDLDSWGVQTAIPQRIHEIYPGLIQGIFNWSFFSWLLRSVGSDFSPVIC